MIGRTARRHLVQLMETGLFGARGLHVQRHVILASLRVRGHVTTPHLPTVAPPVWETTRAHVTVRWGSARFGVTGFPEIAPPVVGMVPENVYAIAVQVET